jgi:hypothetical protein
MLENMESLSAEFDRQEGIEEEEREVRLNLGKGRVSFKMKRG